MEIADGVKRPQINNVSSTPRAFYTSSPRVRHHHGLLSLHHHSPSTHLQQALHHLPLRSWRFERSLQHETQTLEQSLFVTHTTPSYQRRVQRPFRPAQHEALRLFVTADQKWSPGRKLAERHTDCDYIAVTCGALFSETGIDDARDGECPFEGENRFVSEEALKVFGGARCEIGTLMNRTGCDAMRDYE